MHSNSSLLIIVHVHENEEELNRILPSITKNHSLSTCTLIVINNATNKEIAQKISNTCSIYPNVKLELNQFNWPLIRDHINIYLEHNGIKTSSNWLKQLNIGEKGWNVHYARNVGMAIAKLCYPEKEYILNFDSDILIPQDLKICCPLSTKLTCLKILGCPDLSRVEWMTVYVLFLFRKYSIGFSSFTNQYCYRLVTELSMDILGGIINTYSSIELDKKYPEPPDGLIFPTREEYHGACYFIATSELGRSAYSQWYDNDWFFFKEIRKGTEELRFIDQYVSHRSAVKQILSSEAIYAEEEGQIINIIYEYITVRGYNKEDAMEQSTLNRKAIICEIMELICLLNKQPISNSESAYLYKVLQSLKNLVQYIDAMSIDELMEKIRGHNIYQREWHEAFIHLGDSSMYNNDLVQVVHNYARQISI